MRRVTFDISEELLNQLNTVVPWGIRQRLMTSLMSQVVDMGREYGEVGLAAIISNKVNLKTAMEVMLDGYARRSKTISPGAATGSSDVSGPSSSPVKADTEKGIASDGVGGTDSQTD